MWDHVALWEIDNFTVLIATVNSKQPQFSIYINISSIVDAIVYILMGY